MNDAGPQTMNGSPARVGAWSRLKRRYGVGGWGVVAILLTFALAGMTVLEVSGPIMHGIAPKELPNVLWWAMRVLITLPIYEVLLLGYGTLLGQRRFFWDKQVKLVRRFMRSPAA
jgi:hypothetical protein